MSTKLDWVYQDRSGEYQAAYKGLVIRAIRDDHAENPFEDHDGHWPMLVRHDRIGQALGGVLGRFNDHALIHDQKAIAQALNSTIMEATSHQDHPCNWCRDADALREGFENLLYDMSGIERLDALAELYKLLSIPCLRHSSHGYVQSQWAELLIVATPEAQEALRSQPADMDDETWAKTLAEDIAGQAKLYDAWAWGDVYGFVVHRPEPNGDVNLCENLDSCWGFYGSDFDWSGLEEAAIAAVEGFVGEKTDVDT